MDVGRLHSAINQAFVSSLTPGGAALPGCCFIKEAAAGWLYRSAIGSG